MKILLVDDDDAVRASIRMILKMKKFEVIEAASGAAGIDIAKKGSGIAAVLVDLYMPGASGLETIAAIREALPSVPIIAMSGSVSRTETSSPSEFTMASDAGAIAVMHKPFRPDELMAILNNALVR